MLKLSVRLDPFRSTRKYATIKVLIDNKDVGEMCVTTNHPDEVVALLNAATELWEMTQEVADVYGWHGTAPKGRCTCLPCRARKVLAKAKGAT